MGNFAGTIAIPSDSRIERCVKTFDIPQKKIRVLWKIFTQHSTEAGLLQFETFCEAVLKYPRNPIVDAIPTFFNTKFDATVTFGEFVEIICSFACFEQWDLLKYMYAIMDPNHVGLVEKHELKLFLYRMWHNRPYDNVDQALAFLEDIDEDGSFTFKEVVQLRDVFPHIFYPLYQFQVHVVAHSFGELWWETHKYLMIENRRLKQERALAQLQILEKKQKQMLSLVPEEVVRSKMGILYYIMPWKIPHQRNRLMKIAAMEQELEHEYMDRAVQRGFVSKSA